MERCGPGSFSMNSRVPSSVTKLTSSGKLLLQSVKEGNEELARKLISLGVSVDIRDQFGCAPVFYAARYNHLSVLKMLIECDAFINATTIMNRTALQIAAYHGHTDCVQYLIDMRANMNAVDDLGMSALHWAAENNHKSTVETLLRAGADLTLVNKFGKSAQRLAFLKNNIEIYELLEDNNVSDSLDIDETTKTFSVFLSQPNMIDESSILKNRLLESRFENIATTNKSDTIKLFEQHGIKLLPVDESTLVANALKRGQTAVLTEAGKLALKKTEPSFLHNLVEPNAANPFVQMSSKIVEKERLRRLPQKSRISCPEIGVSKAKIAKINVLQSTNVATNHTSKKPCIDSKMPKPRKKNTIMTSEEHTQLMNTAKKCRELEQHTKFLEEQLSNKSQAVKSLKNQLEVSLKLMKSLKTKYEMKEREACLYKIQLQNLLKMLARQKVELRTR